MRLWLCLLLAAAQSAGKGVVGPGGAWAGAGGLSGGASRGCLGGGRVQSPGLWGSRRQAARQGQPLRGSGKSSRELTLGSPGLWPPLPRSLQLGDG